MRERELFIEALERSNLAERAALLDEACAADSELRGRIEMLLAAHERQENFILDAPVVPFQATAVQLIRECPGTVVGPYKLLQQIGEGGMGVVFMAEQAEPIQRTVALKIIKPGMDTRQVIARFEAERQALAMMDHPNIAKVLDAGTTDSGRPYFVMELVKGVPITKYCDEKLLPVRARLELFIDVCQAVQHAHQKGIIHRDIKPNNVLVAEYDNHAVPKVIDFGVAKATAQRLTERTMFTEFGQVLGTMEYMSPEQSKFNQLDIDTRSDIYSLGVMLYELLAGSTPFEGKRLHAAAFDEMLRIIREEEPPKPSTRLSSLTTTSDSLPLAGRAGEGVPTTLASIAANRHTEPARLSKDVQGELDWIVMKALEKDRNRRYETASGFAADIERHLHDEPVAAGPPSKTYRLRKLARRHSTALQVGAAFVLLLITTTVFSSWQAVRATRAKAATLAQMQRADQQAAVADRITKSLQQLLASANPDASRGPDYTVRALLDDFAATLDSRLADQPEISAALHGTIGKAYWSLNVLDKAKQHTARALELRRGVFGAQHEKYADSLVDCAWTIEPNQAGFAEGVADVRQALAIYRARGVEGERVISALRTLQMIYVWQSRFKEIEAVADEAFAEARKSPGVEFADLPAIRQNLVFSKIAFGELAEAERISRETVATYIRSGRAEHMGMAWAYKELGSTLLAQNKFKEALAAEQQSLAIMRKAVSPNHPYIGHPLAQVIATLVSARKSHALAELFPSPAQLAELESFFRQIQASQPSAPDKPWDPATLASQGLAEFPALYLELSKELSAAQRTHEADEYHQKGVALLDSLQNEFASNPDLLAQLYAAQISFLMDDGSQQQARDLGRKLLALTPKKPWVLNHVAWFLATDANPANWDPALAVELAKKAVQINPDRPNFRNTLGVARYRAGEFKQAAADLEESMQLRMGGNSWEFFFLAMTHWQLGDKDEARKWYDQAVAWMDMNRPPANDELRRFRAEADELMKNKSEASENERKPD